MLKKRIMSVLLCLCLVSTTCLIPAHAFTYGDWSNGWELWSQGQSSYEIMRSFGCFLVAKAKMLVAAGIASTNTNEFNPDIYYLWETNNGYTNSGLYAIYPPTGPCEYARRLGRSLTYEGQTNGNNTNKVWENINAGKFTILRMYLSTGSHYVFVNNRDSIATGRIRVYESWSGTDIPGTRDLNSTISEIHTYSTPSTPSYPIGSENIGDDFYAYIRSGLGSLNVTNAGTGSGYGNVQTARANAYDPRQIWHFIWDSGRNAYGIVNMYDGRYLDVLNGKNERFTNIGVCDNNGGDPQRWRLVYEPSGQRSTFNLVPYYTDSWVMDIENASAVPGTNIRIDQRWQNDAQRYTISKISDINTILTCNLGADFYARISYNGAYLQTLSTITESGRNMDVVTTRTLNSTDPKQIWHFIRQSNGSYKIKNAYSESDSWCLDVQNASAANGATIRMYFDDNGVAAQRWYLINSLGESKYRIASALLYPGELYSLDFHNAEGAKDQLWQQNANLWQFFNISKVAYTNPGKPSAPTNIQVTATSSGTTITWDAVPAVSAYDSRAYRVYLASISENQVLIPQTIVNGTSYTSDIVLPDGDYEVILQSVNTKYPNLRSTMNWLDFSVAPTTHTVSVSAATGGTASGGGAYQDGASVTVSAAASAGYEFKCWTENGKAVSTEAVYTFAVSADRTLIATFEKKQAPAPATYTINISADPTGAGTVSGSGTYQKDEAVKITATASTGYSFKHWAENGTEVSTDAVYTFTAAADRTLVAVFDKDEDAPPPDPGNIYTVSVSADPAEGGAVSGGGTYPANTSATVKASASAGYTFSGWMESGAKVSTDAIYTFSVTGDTALTAAFEADTPISVPTYRINVGATAGGTVSGGGSYEENSAVTVTAKPNSGYWFVAWQENGVQVSTSSSYGITVTADKTLTAIFEKIGTQPPTITHTVNVSANLVAGGTVSGGGDYPKGTSITLLAEVNNGYRFVAWMEDGAQVSTNASYTFTVDGDTTLVAVFEAERPDVAPTYTVNVNAEPAENGSVSGGGTYTEGEPVTITATPNDGYQFVEWRLNGSRISTTANYTFTAHATQTYTAVFEKAPEQEEPPTPTHYTINLSASPSSGGTVTGSGSYEQGASATVTATPSTNYRFVRWTENGTQVSTNANYAFTVVTDRVLVAEFAYMGNPSNPDSSSDDTNYIPPVTLPVKTDKISSGTGTVAKTTASPVATVSGGKAVSTVSTAIANEMVKQAVSNNSESVIISPEVKGTVTRTEVTIPASAVEKIGRDTDANLIVSTPVGSVTIPNGALTDLSTGSNVTVAVEQNGNAAAVTIAAGNQTIGMVPGGVILNVPTASGAPGTVAVLVNEDGIRQIIRKSVVKGGSVAVPLSGSAKVEIVDNAKTFTDVSPEHWAADAVAFASGHELFSGTGNSTFSPDLPMTRGMLALVLHNLENNPDANSSAVFSDVANGVWYEAAVSWAAERSIISGYGNGLFGPGDNITREQLAVILWRYTGMPTASGSSLAGFTDASTASTYALDALEWAVKSGIISGNGSGILDPKGFATRAQVAQIFMNYLMR